MTEQNPSKTANQQDRTESPTPKKKRWGRRLLILLMVLVLAVAVLVALAPSVASSEFGRQRLVQMVNGKIPGSIQLDALKLSWTGGQSIDGLEISGPEGDRVLSLERLQLTSSLVGIVRGGRNLGTLTIDGLDADIVLDENGQSNLQRAFKDDAVKQPAQAPKQVESTPKPSTDNSNDGQASQLPKNLAVAMQINDAKLRVTSPKMNPILTHFNATVDMTRPSEPIRAAIKGNSVEQRPDGGDGQAGQFDLEMEVSSLTDAAGRLQPKMARVQANGELKNLPIQMIDGLLSLDGMALAALGPQLNLTVTSAGGADSNQVSLQANSANLNAQFSGLLEDQQRLVLTSPATFELMVTRELVSLLMASAEGDPPLSLAADFPVALTIAKLVAPVKGTDPSATALQANLTAGEVRLSGDPSVGEVALNGLSVSLGAEKLSEGIDLQIQGTTKAAGESNRFQLSADLHEFIDDNGDLVFDQLTGNLDGTVSVPVTLLNFFLKNAEQRQTVAATLGSLLTVIMNAQLAPAMHSFTLDFNATHTRAHIAGQIADDKFTLVEPLTAEQNVTEQLGRVVLKKVNPLLVTALSADEPIKLHVDNENFRVPLKSFDISQMQVGNASIELGKLELANGKLLGRILSLFRSGTLGAEDRMTAWFTPINVSVSEGVARYERMDALIAGRLHIATWGEVNLVEDTLEMVLGIPADTLQTTIGANVPDDYVLQIPMRGKTDDPKIDWPSATLQIASLAASSQLKGKIAEGIKVFEGLQSVLNRDKEKSGPALLSMPQAPPAPELPWGPLKKNQVAEPEPPNQDAPQPETKTQQEDQPQEDSKEQAKPQQPVKKLIESLFE